MARCCRTTLAWMIRKSAIDFRGRDQAQQKYTTTAWFVDCPRTELCIAHWSIFSTNWVRRIT